MKIDDTLYRPCVGIALFNRAGDVFIGERLDNPGAWQMPQGGIDAGEAPEIAVFREMEEEIGTTDARILGVLEDWLYYDVPAETAQRAWNSRYVGQRQKWIALEFLGADSDIRLDAFSHPEFGQWKWTDLDGIAAYAVPFKRHIYTRVSDAFLPYARLLRQK